MSNISRPRCAFRRPYFVLFWVCVGFEKFIEIWMGCGCGWCGWCAVRLVVVFIYIISYITCMFDAPRNTECFAHLAWDSLQLVVIYYKIKRMKHGQHLKRQRQNDETNKTDKITRMRAKQESAKREDRKYERIRKEKKRCSSNRCQSSSTLDEQNYGINTKDF